MPSMKKGKKRADDAVLWKTRREHLRLECRECEVICERVVSPWQCLRSQCKYIYSYDDRETTYFGCLHKVFLPELDLAAFTERENGFDKAREKKKKGDPYGPVRVSRTPRPECRVTVEQAYETQTGGGNCCNPTFFHEPAGPVDDTIRLTAKRPGGGPRQNDSHENDPLENDPDHRD